MVYYCVTRACCALTEPFNSWNERRRIWLVRAKGYTNLNQSAHLADSGGKSWSCLWLYGSKLSLRSLGVYYFSHKSRSAFPPSQPTLLPFELRRLGGVRDTSRRWRLGFESVQADGWRGVSGPRRRRRRRRLWGEPCSCSGSCAMHGPLRQVKRRSEKKPICGWRRPSETSPCCRWESGSSPVWGVGGGCCRPAVAECKHGQGKRRWRR